MWHEKKFKLSLSIWLECRLYFNKYLSFFIIMYLEHLPPAKLERRTAYELELSKLLFLQVSRYRYDNQQEQ